MSDSAAGSHSKAPIRLMMIRSRLHGKRLAITYFAGICFVDTAKYHGSLFLNESQIFNDSNCGD